MLLTIIIPQYTENEQRIAPLLHTIDLQRGVDFRQIEVIIVNDCSDTILSSDFLNSFTHFKPHYLRTPKNLGPGLCRQYGLDRAQGDYVTFCDADDLYQTIGTLSYYMAVIKERQPDILRTTWLEELQTPQGLIYITHKPENTWLHGKCYSRRFLVYNNIRFSDELFYHEDSYFNSCAAAMTENQIESDALTYMWTWDDNTITRRNNSAYSYTSMEEFTKAIRLSCHWIKERKPDILPQKVAQCLAYVFYCVTDGMNNGWAQEAVNGTVNEMKRMYSEFAAEYNSLEPWRIAQIDLEERNKITQQKPYVPTMTFQQFMQNVVKEPSGAAQSGVKQSRAVFL